MQAQEQRIARVAVTSSNIRAVGYDAGTKTLEVEFSNGGIYRYADVPGEAWHGLVKADSIGRHFAAHIRGVFDARKVDPPTKTDAEAIRSLLEGLYQSEEERTEWLWTPQPLLGGAVPFKLIGAGRAADVLAALKQVAEGNFT